MRAVRISSMLLALLLCLAVESAQAASEGDIIVDQFGASIYRNGSWEHYDGPLPGSSGGASSSTSSSASSSSSNITYASTIGASTTTANQMTQYNNLLNEYAGKNLPQEFNNGSQAIDWQQWTSGQAVQVDVSYRGLLYQESGTTKMETVGDAIHRQLLLDAYVSLRGKSTECFVLLTALQKAIDAYLDAFYESHRAEAERLARERLLAAERAKLDEMLEWTNTLAERAAVAAQKAKEAEVLIQKADAFTKAIEADGRRLTSDERTLRDNMLEAARVAKENAREVEALRQKKSAACETFRNDMERNVANQLYEETQKILHDMCYKDDPGFAALRSAADALTLQVARLNMEAEKVSNAVGMKTTANASSEIRDPSGTVIGSGESDRSGTYTVPQSLK